MVEDGYETYNEKHPRASNRKDIFLVDLDGAKPLFIGQYREICTD